MAIESIAQIKANRNKLVNEAANHVVDKMCSHFFGFVKHRKYDNFEDAKENSPEANRANDYARTDENLCELILAATEFTGPDAILQISLQDFRALKPL